jgi:hypothetical protein
MNKRKITTLAVLCALMTGFLYFSLNKSSSKTSQVGEATMAFTEIDLSHATQITCTFPRILNANFMSGQISHNLSPDETSPMIFTFSELDQKVGQLASIDSTRTITTTPVPRLLSNDERAVYLSFNENHFSSYTIFKKTGVVLYTKSVDIFGIPSGSLAMGSCVGY